MRQRGTQSRRGDEFGPDTQPVRPVRRPPSGGPGSGGGFWPALAIAAIIVATAGWTTVAVMALNGGGKAVAVAVPSVSDTLPSDDPNASASDVPAELSHDAPAVEAFLPTHVNQTILTIQSWTGDSVLSDDAWSTSLTSFLTSKGKKPTDLQVATGYDDADENGPSVGVSRLAGVDGPSLEAAIIAAWKVESPDMVVSTLTIDGKAVTKGVFGEGYVDSYWYQRNDLVFDIETSDATLLTSILQSLPAAGASTPPASAGPSGSAKPSAAPSASPVASPSPS